jgi:uncharacterized membrane protein
MIPFPTSEPTALMTPWFVAPGSTPVELTAMNAVQWLRLAIEIIGAIVLSVGVVRAAWTFARDIVLRGPGEFTAIRLTLGRYLSLALEFQLGADILSTAVSPSWDEIGKLGAIAVIRTALNYFLSLELREADRTMKSEQDVEAHDVAAGGSPHG